VANGNLRPIAVDLFAGAGGMTLGFEQAGFDVLASIEIDPIHACTHKYNFPFWTVLCRDITNTTGKQIRELSTIGGLRSRSLRERDIDVVFGGPPCQGFSLIGKRNLEDSRNSLVFHFLRLVLELQPKFFVMENVRGIAVGKQKQFLQTVIDEFEKHNYQVRENYQILNAAFYGVPQNRHRLFLIGCRQGFSLPNYPQPLTQVKSQKSKVTEYKTEQFFSSSSLFPLPSSLPTTPTVRDAIGDLPEANNYPELWFQDWTIAEYGKPSQYASELRNLIPVTDDYSYLREYNSRLLTCSRLTQHTEKTISRFIETSPGKKEKISHFYRLHLDGLCSTLRAGTPGDRGAFTSPRPIHPITPRCITVREAARLHSYPDWFRFHETKWHGFRQIGNSVPPLLAKAVAKEIINSLGIQPEKPTTIYELEALELLQFRMKQAGEYFNVDAKSWVTT
jgi:DNA (cytosine-5)-methyltransferase 1